MTRILPPLLGYNNNVRYLGRTFHIQTEDSGTKYARIMTHLFVDGGRIVKSTRTEYGAVVGQPDMAETVRRMMKEQHKNMFLSLRAGEFDPLIERVTGEGVATSTPIPAPSRVPQLRADSSLPPLSLAAGEEPKTLPGMSTLVIDRKMDAVAEALPVPELVPDEAVQTELRKRASGQFAAAAAVGRPSNRPRKAKSSYPPGGARRARQEDRGAPSEHLEVKSAVAKARPSERPSRKLAVRPPTQTQEAIDPRSQSIFGEASAGKQTLDEVILSFLEDEES